MNPYAHRSWAAAVRHWKRKPSRLTCARCGGTINRSPGRGPDSLDVGHIIGIVTAKQLGWTVEELNSIPNTQPEHSRCNRKAGAHHGNALRRQGREPTNRTTRDW